MTESIQLLDAAALTVQAMNTDINRIIVVALALAVGALTGPGNQP